MRRLLIWDLAGIPPTDRGDRVLWRHFSSGRDTDVISIPRIVEAHADAIRTRYLAWLYDLGQAPVRGRPLQQQLELREGFSYWWSTEVAQNANYYRAAWITDAIKCLAFEQYVVSASSPQVIGAIELRTQNLALRAVLAEFCARRGLAFRAVVTESATVTAPAVLTERQSVRRAVQSLIAAVSGRSGRSTPGAGAPASTDVCFFDILVYLSAGSLASGTFTSHYWGTLPEAVNGSGARSRWLHLFYPHAELPTLADALAAVRRFSASTGGAQLHELLDEAAVGRVWWRAVRDYLRLWRGCQRWRPEPRFFSPTGSDLTFWPLLEASWKRSFRSPTALSDCLRLALFECALAKWPPQRLGVFIQENQPWELALIYAWRRAGHGTIVGVPHTTVRFWDLRYFRDRRVYAETGAGAMPRPDVVAVNGTAPAVALRDAGYPAPEIVEVEALRFDHLAQDSLDSSISVSVDSPDALRILVCGDNIPDSNERMLALVGAAAGRVPAATSWTFKPHGARPFDPAPWAGFDLPVSDRPLAVLLRECDIVVTGNVTSAAADAYGRGLGVAVMLDGASLNGSPVRGLPSIGYFADGEELANFVNTFRRTESAPRQMFHIDPALPRWRSLLGLSPAKATEASQRPSPFSRPHR